MPKSKIVKVNPGAIFARNLQGAMESALRNTALEILALGGFTPKMDNQSPAVKRVLSRAKQLSAKRAAAARKRWKKAKKAA